MSNKLNAQALPQGGNGGCVIKYDYDAGGNRIKRSKYCWAGGGAVQRSLPEISKALILEMQVYPNPASSYVTVSMNMELQNAKIELQDMTGKVIASKILSDLTIDFDTRYLAQGTYMMVLRRKESNKVMVQKFVKE